MKTYSFSLLLASICLISNAKAQSSIFTGISVVTTSAGHAAELSWQKGTENVSYFIVERSSDGTHFKQCGLVFVSEEPGFTDYKFRDKIRAGSDSAFYGIGVVNDQEEVYYLPAKKLMAPENL